MEWGFDIEKVGLLNSLNHFFWGPSVLRDFRSTAAAQASSNSFKEKTGIRTRVLWVSSGVGKGWGL